MRAVLDTNVVISGMLWQGPSRQVLNLAREGKIELFTTAELLTELEDILNREKFQRRLRLAQVQTIDLIAGYAALATVIRPAKIAPFVHRDPDDDAVIACAAAAKAGVIVSGDSDLLDLKQYQGVQIISAAGALTRLRN